MAITHLHAGTMILWPHGGRLSEKVNAKTFDLRADIRRFSGGDLRFQRGTFCGMLNATIHLRQVNNQSGKPLDFWH